MPAPWQVVANKYTKLQTESGNYHVDFFLPDYPATTDVEGEPYKILHLEELYIVCAKSKIPSLGVMQLEACACVGNLRIWPTRDQLLKMFRQAAKDHELGGFLSVATQPTSPDVSLHYSSEASHA